MFSASGLQVRANQGRYLVRELYSFEEGNAQLSEMTFGCRGIILYFTE